MTNILSNRLDQLAALNKQIKELALKKEKYEAEIAELLHPHDNCRKTYATDKYKVIITTSYNYKVDIKKYEEIKEAIPSVFNPVSIKTKYEVSKRVIDALTEHGTDAEKMLVAQAITATPAKLHIGLSHVEVTENGN